MEEFIKTYEFQLKLVFLIGFTIGCHYLYKNNKEWLNLKGVVQKWNEDLLLKVGTVLWMMLSWMGGIIFVLICLIEGGKEIERRLYELPWWGQLLLCMSFILFFYSLYIWRYDKPKGDPKKGKVD